MKSKKLFLCLLAAAFTLTPVCGAYAAPEIVEGDGTDSILIKQEDDTESKAEGTQSIAIGNKVYTQSAQSIAFGNNAKVTTNINAGASETGGIAIGANASAIGGGTTVGAKSSAMQWGVALGQGAKAAGQAIAIGYNAQKSGANGTESVVIGYEAYTKASYDAIVIGSQANSGLNANGSITIGTDSNTNAIGAIALGRGAKATGLNSIAIGENSTANEQYTVSLGSSKRQRRLVNLAAGKANTDGVNVSQLNNLGTIVESALGGETKYSFNSETGKATMTTALKVGSTTYNSVQDALDAVSANSTGGGSENAVEYDGDDKSTVTLDGKGGTTITNVADGSADSDAVNFKQLSAVSEEAKNKGSWTLNAGESANVIGDGDGITIAEGSNLKITAESGTYTFGVVDNPEFASVKIGDYTISHNNGLDMGGAVLDNVAAGSIASGSMQAVNGGQLFTTNTNLSNLGGSVASAFGGAWNYENGALSGEFTYNGSGTTLQGALDSISAKLDELSEGWYFEANDGGASGEAGTGAGESQIKPGDKLTVNAGEDINITQNGDKDYTISVDPNLKEEIKDGYTTADNILKEEITDDYTTADNILKEQITNDYTTADNVLKEQIKNDYTTADNVLKEEITDAYTNADNVMKEEITDAYTTADNVLKEQIKDDYTTADNVLKEQIKNDYTTADNIVREEFKAADSELRADIDKSAATIEEIGGVLGGAENGYMTPTFNSVTANSLTMGNYTMSATNSGFDMGGARLSGIADGGIYRGSSDAVTGNQLWEAYNRMDDLGERINVVGAHAAALSGLHPIDYNPYEPTTLSAAIGTYRDEYAVAVGVFHYTRENVMFNLGASLCSDGDIMGRAGVSFTLGKSSKKQPLPPKDMNEVQAQLAQVQQALFELKAENKELREKLEAQR